MRTHRLCFCLSLVLSFGNPNTSFGSSNFGQITSASGARALQVAAKFYF